jgi:hypothetical protein
VNDRGARRGPNPAKGHDMAEQAKTLNIEQAAADLETFINKFQGS